MAERTIDPKYVSAITHLVEGRTMFAAAQLCGINVRTLRRWMQLPEFIEEYNIAKREHKDIQSNRLTCAASHATHTLFELMDDPNPAVRIRAARTAYELYRKDQESAEKSRKAAALERRILELEDQLAEMHSIIDNLDLSDDTTDADAASEPLPFHSEEPFVLATPPETQDALSHAV